jgi:hypothetical protein
MIVRIKPFQSEKTDRLNIFSQVTQLIMLYNGMFYITGLGKWYMDPDNGVDWAFLLVIIIPSLVFFFMWMNAVRLQLMIILFNKNRTLFKALTLNLINMNTFKARYIDEPVVSVVADDEDDMKNFTPRGGKWKNGGKKVNE